MRVPIPHQATILALLAASAGAQDFIRGDANGDGRVTSLDATAILHHLTLAPIVRCDDAADVNDDGMLSVADATALLGWATYTPGAAPPLSPFPEAGEDPTRDRLECLDPAVRPPAVDPAYSFTWLHAPSLPANARDVPLTLLVTTAGPIRCLAIACRVDRSLVDLSPGGVRVDLEGTVFPADLRSDFEASPAFHVEVTDSADPAFALLRVRALYDDLLKREDFPATQRPLTAEPLLRVVVDLRSDGPVRPGPAGILLRPALPEDLPPDRPAEQNEVCLEHVAVFPGLVAPVRVRIDPAVEPRFVRADADLSGTVSPLDAYLLMGYLFLGRAPPRCLDAADSSDDGEVTLADVTYLLNALFVEGSPPPPAPFPASGPDPTDDALGCAESGVDPPAIEIGYEIGWSHAPEAHRGQTGFDLYLTATTATAIECFSIAYRLDRRAVAELRIDFEGTILPPAFRPACNKTLSFQCKRTPIDPQFDRLEIAALFVDGGLSLDFPATRGPIVNERLLHLQIDLTGDAPLDPAFVLLEPATREPLPPGAGLYNELCRTTPGGEGGGGQAAPPEPEGVVPEDPGSAIFAIVDGEEFLRGDVNGDGTVDLSDAVSIPGYLFLGTAPRPGCIDAADANGDELVDISDALWITGYLFLGRSAPPYPFNESHICERAPVRIGCEDARCQ